ncbi:MAG: FAD-binding oxidoreductase [Proteobacteria bacterium]|nr:FAD-binding oxidoreductase [Pseudomonadota bacterium]
MTFMSQAYRKLEDVVGKDYISRDPAILDSYAAHATVFGVPRPGLGVSPWWNRAGAVILPDTTGQVSRILQLCNEYGIQYKAHSTGQMPFAFPMNEGSLTIDLSRMNRIIEIDQDHGYALVEPGVTQGELFIECIKYGWAPHMTDAGSSTSPLASVTSVSGEGDSGISRGFNERNAMSIEWVLPTGKIMKLGSSQFPKAGWFSGDGPGPSLLGMMRGAFGAFGERGVFTKAGIKLYPWHGPKLLKKGGAAPWFEIDEGDLAINIWLKWDNSADEANGLYSVGESEIFDSFGKLSATKLEAILADSKSEWADLRRSETYSKFMPNGIWLGSLMAKNEAHMDYCKKCANKISKETNASIYFGFNEFPVPNGFDADYLHFRLEQALTQLFHLKDYTSKAVIMPMMGTIGPLPAVSHYSIDSTLQTHEKICKPAKIKAQKKGEVLNDGPEGSWCILEDGGHTMLYMNLTRIERKDPKAKVRGLPLNTAIKIIRSGGQLMAASPALDKIKPVMSLIRTLSFRLDPKQLSSLSPLSGALSKDAIRQWSSPLGISSKKEAWILLLLKIRQMLTFRKQNRDVKTDTHHLEN